MKRIGVVRGKLVAGRWLLAIALPMAVSLSLVAQANAYVYWADNSFGAGSVGRANLDGSNASGAFIGTNTDNPDGVAVDGSHVYWAVEGGADSPAIGRANIDGSSPTQRLFVTGGLPSGVALDGSHIYWINTYESGPIGHSIGRANLDGSGVEDNFITNVGTPDGLAVSGSYIYWGDGTSIARANLDGSNPNLSFITGASGVDGVAVDSRFIYWTNVIGGSNDSIGRANIDGSSPSQSFITGLNAPSGLAVNSAHLYWADKIDGSIAEANLDGSGVNQGLVSNAGMPYAVAVDAGPAPPTHALTVTVSGSGSGTVTSSPAGISCPGTCSHAFQAGIEVSLTETAAAGSTFGGWSGGGCAATAPCSVSMDADRTVTATFTAGALAPPPPPSGAVSSASASSTTSGGTATAATAGTTVSAVGTGALTVSQYGGDPAGAPSFSSAGRYFDVQIAPGSSFSTLTVTDCNLNNGTTLQWWDGHAWLAVNPISYSIGPPACATTTLSSTSTPTIAELTGTVFAVSLRGKATAGTPKVHGARVSVPIRCTGGRRSSCSVALTLTEAGKRVVLGTKTANIKAGHSKTVVVSLNRTGKRLLAHRHRLQAKLAVSQSGKTLSTRTLTFKLKR
jgi:sugar lactone lactonase YvrE